MQSEDDGSDESAEVVDLLPEEAAVRVQCAMANMLVKLEDCDPQDIEWLPPKKCKKIVPKKIGRISFPTRAMRELTMGPRKSEGALSWPQCSCEVSTHATMLQAHLCNEKSNKTH
jgi:hypothetical protein